MPNTYYDRLQARRGSVPLLPAIKDENETENNIQDFCEALFGTTDGPEFADHPKVRCFEGAFNEDSEKHLGITQTNSGLGGKARFNWRRGSDGVFSLGKKQNTSKHKPRRSKQKPANRNSLPGQTNERNNSWNDCPEIIDLTTEEDVQKLALEFFSQQMKMDNETLEKTLERIYGGADLESKCIEFAQVGNCKPVFQQSKWQTSLPAIGVSKADNKEDVKKNETMKLPSIFQVFYSNPVGPKILQKDSTKLKSSFNYQRKRYSYS